MERLHQKLKNLSMSEDYPFHMPGHKRNGKDKFPSYYDIDITEIEGFDNLACPCDVIKNEENSAAQIFASEESYFLVNGSTCGILASIFTCCKPNDKILFARNAHKAAYNAVNIRSLKAIYVYPPLSEYGNIPLSISPSEIEREIIQHKNIKAVFITSPTYEGIISDIEKICDIAHSFHIPVIVDEAHGAHMGIWGKELNQKSAIECGADLIIQSLHKTLPSLTQTAIIHKQGNLINSKALQNNINIFQSSSPSYVLLDSITECIHYCYENKEKLYNQYMENLLMFYKRTESLNNIVILNKSNFKNCFTKDIGKIIIFVGNTTLNGHGLSEILSKKYHLIMEMASFDYVIAMTSIMDTNVGLERLVEALIEIDSTITKKVKNMVKTIPVNKKCLEIEEAILKDTVCVELDNSVNKISAEFCYLYPPGIPYIVPGEKISREAIGLIQHAKEVGLTVLGLEDLNQNFIKIINMNGEL